MRTAFDYLYRDAGNFKAFGTLVLEGPFDDVDRRLIASRLSGGEFFIAEQVGVPPLYRQLYRWSDGPTDSDHCWHEFVAFRSLENREGDTLPVFRASDFLSSWASVTDWDESRSPHFWL